MNVKKILIINIALLIISGKVLLAILQHMQKGLEYINIEKYSTLKDIKKTPYNNMTYINPIKDTYELTELVEFHKTYFKSNNRTHNTSLELNNLLKVYFL